MNIEETIRLQGEAIDSLKEKVAERRQVSVTTLGSLSILRIRVQRIEDHITKIIDILKVRQETSSKSIELDEKLMRCCQANSDAIKLLNKESLRKESG